MIEVTTKGTAAERVCSTSDSAFANCMPGARLPCPRQFTDQTTSPRKIRKTCDLISLRPPWRVVNRDAEAAERGRSTILSRAGFLFRTKSAKPLHDLQLRRGRQPRWPDNAKRLCVRADREALDIRREHRNSSAYPTAAGNRRARGSAVGVNQVGPPSGPRTCSVAREEERARDQR